MACTSVLQNGVSSVSEPRAVHVQNDSDRLVLELSLTIGDVASSLTNETMPWRHKGQAIEPGGTMSYRSRAVCRTKIQSTASAKLMVATYITKSLNHLLMKLM
ncbi:hypothetical protein POM88_001741 [Heracleum sosnowskyi]|uniref:Uncharacterized protein n=1 Tax=Heracleum sosnowskyi TaxID=360622 RepID=A0AAD8NB61_9APIA|nr:hypothetical protein POM88_001741 [Heracleum sosnowskyi]